MFSGLFPIRAVPHEQQAWNMAESFGAECSTELDHTVTHLVAHKPNTDKVNKANSMNDVTVVHENWLYECFMHFRPVKESAFLFQSGVPISSVNPYSCNAVTKEELLSDVLSHPLGNVSPLLAKKPPEVRVHPPHTCISPFS